MKHWQPPHRPIFEYNFTATTKKTVIKDNYFNIFLAGTIEMGKSRDWQKEFIEKITKIGYYKKINIFNPRRDDFDATQEQSIDNPYFSGQVNWELDYLDLSNLIVFNFEPGTISPISIGELCLHIKSKKRKILVYCPKGYTKKGNIDILCKRNGIQQVQSFEELLEETELHIRNWISKQ